MMIAGDLAGAMLGLWVAGRTGAWEAARTFLHEQTRRRAMRRSVWGALQAMADAGPIIAHPLALLEAGAWATEGPLREVLLSIGQAHRSGRPLRAAVRALDAPGIPRPLRLLAHLLVSSTETGLDLGGALEFLLRQQYRWEQALAQDRAATVAMGLLIWILIGMCGVGWADILWTHTGTITWLFHSTGGKALVGSGALLIGLALASLRIFRPTEATWW